MIRTLLAERFKLKLHTETRLTPVYAMVQAKGGAKLKEVDPPPAHVDPQAADDPGKKDKADDKPAPGSFMVSDKGWVAHAVQMRTLLGQIGYETGNQDRLVVDETGLKGYYDFAIKITHGADDPTPEQQIEDGLGLKLEPRKMPVKTYVIDSADKPSVDGAELPNPPTPKPLAFEIVSIRQNVSQPRPQFGPTADGYRAVSVPMALPLMTAAYVPLSGGAAYYTSDRVVGLPEWAEQDRYDIDAKVSAEDMAEWQKPGSQLPMLQAMLRTMLEQRCKLAVHRETKEVSVYSLVVGKNGPKFKETDPTVEHPDGRKMPLGGVLVFGTDSLDLYGVSMAQVASLLTQQIGFVPVQDKTGLTGRYDLVIKEQQHGEPGDAVEDPVSWMMSAIQNNLGLKLQPGKGNVETLVVDHMERPSEN
jgi:uncharacterized protein (TIGR03435 family)